MNDGIRIRLSVGLVVVAIIHAVLLGASVHGIASVPNRRSPTTTLGVCPTRCRLLHALAGSKSLTSRSR